MHYLRQSESYSSSRYIFIIVESIQYLCGIRFHRKRRMNKKRWLSKKKMRLNKRKCRFPTMNNIQKLCIYLCKQIENGNCTIGSLKLFTSVNLENIHLDIY